MNWRSMRLAVKLPLMMAALLVIMGAAAITGFFQLNAALDTFGTDVALAVRQEREVNLMNLAFRSQIQEWKDVLLRGQNPAKRDKYWAAFGRKEIEVNTMATNLEKLLVGSRTRDLIEKFIAAHDEMGKKYRAGFETYQAAGFAFDKGDASVAGMDRAPAALLAQASEELSKNAATISAATLASAQSARRFSILAIGIVALLGLAMGLVLSASVVKQLGGEPSDAAATMQAIANGDLTTKVASRSDAADSLMANLAQMQTSLVGIVEVVRAGTDAIATSSDQIATGVLDLAARTEGQATALEQTAAAMEELNSTVKQNADNALQANELGKSATKVAKHGGAIVAQMAGTMDSISESSRKIADIIGVIDSIAFQTNILALNAAVEAARAGEQGRGFAVVASEVRNLAQRSAGAAKEIKTLIGNSVICVESGVVLVKDAGTTMQAVIDKVSRVDNIIGEIASASNEQTLGIAQINQAIMQIDQVTQQNAALAQEAAVAMKAMREQSEVLSRGVSVFKLGSTSKSVSIDNGVVHKPAPIRQRPRLASLT